jgi:hypothetical protein
MRPQTIENIEVIDERHFIACNDNNLPCPLSRERNKQDDIEFALLEWRSS